MSEKIKLENLTKVYTQNGKDIVGVSDINLSISEGEFIGILGHSGAGKTTLLSLIGGLIRPTRGKVFIDGIDIFSLNDEELSRLRNEKIGFIFQFSSVIPTLSVIDNVLLPLYFAKKPPSDYYSRALVLLEKVGLEGYEDRYAYQLSGGEQRRVAIARAFINYPEIILADEPTGDLDEDTEREIAKFFVEMQKEENLTFIVVSHNPEFIGELCRCTKVYYMKKGRIYEKKN